ncbi:MAG: hypothetical protein ACLRP4_02000 [Dialister invisus]
MLPDFPSHAVKKIRRKPKEDCTTGSAAAAPVDQSAFLSELRKGKRRKEGNAVNRKYSLLLVLITLFLNLPFGMDKGGLPFHPS